MKVHGFNSTIPPSDNTRKIQKPIEQPSSSDAGEKTKGKNEILKGPASSRSGAVDQICPAKDTIELNANQAAAPGKDGFPQVGGINDSTEPGQQSPGGIYSVESISRATSETDYVSRRERIIKARQNIADGYYNSPEFIEKLAEILIEKFYLSGESD